MDLIYSYAAILVAYLVGSLSFAVIVTRLMGLSDPRSYGSKNPGATNVLRSGNKAAAALTLLLDALKGWLPTVLVARFAPALGLGQASVADTVIAFVGLAAFLGHLFPVFFRFRGGKGVATAAGVMLAFEPLLGAVVLALWIAVAALTRYSSLAAIVAAVFAPFLTLMFFDRPAIALSVSLMSLLLLWRHWRNIVNLLTGKESRIGQKSAEPHGAAGPHRGGRHRLHGDAHGAAAHTRSKGK
jgi:glycerol-3-phosphate acyltransferase PlsY